MAIGDPKPRPKSAQLSRGQRRYRRIVASPKQWAAIVEAKQGPCRVCTDPAANGRLYGRIEFHHLVSRAALGDDVADNIAPLCPSCHLLVTQRIAHVLAILAANLTDAEYAYCIAKMGEGAMERLFGISDDRRGK